MHLPSTIVLLCGATALQAVPLGIELDSPRHNGYHISCNGGQDGAIDLTITGGQAPYTILWTNGATTEDLSGLSAGYYAVGVVDALGAREEKEITLEEPPAFVSTVEVYQYPNGYNVSCYQCYNGSLEVLATGGVPPYAYAWKDVPTGDSVRTGLGAGDLSLEMKDQNDCAQAHPKIIVTEPQRSDWTMEGNAGTDPATQYIGTSDHKDLLLKTDGVERLRIRADGSLKMAGLIGGGLLNADSSGVLSLVPMDQAPMPLNALPYWSTLGNYTTTTHEIDEVLGTRDATPLKVITDNTERMRLTSGGRLGLGTTSPTEKLEVHHADERGGILLNNTLPDNAHSEVRFADGATQRWGLGCDLAALDHQDFFLWDDVAEAVRLYVQGDGRIGLGTTAPKGALHVDSPGPTRSVVSAGTSTNAESWVYNELFGYGLRVDSAGRGRIMYDFHTPQTAISLTNNGNVGIGLDPPGGSELYRLYVEGGIACRDVKVTIGQFEDRVFEKDYTLMTLPELRTFLDRHGHLPTMPKGSTVEAEGGMEVGDLQMRLLRTVEEQALYILQLEERLQALEAGRR